MAESTSYPQIPSTVWAGVWKIVHDSPSRKIDENVLAIELGVQKTAAKQYLNELTRLGLFTAEGQSTDLAKKWRLDGDDPEVIGKILEFAYPQELREIAPLGKLDKDKIVRWFIAQGLGAGSANNKAATYIRVASGVSASDAPKITKSGDRPAKAKASRRNPPSGEKSAAVDVDPPRPLTRKPELAVNVQIHISADSTKEQIDAIFSAMRKYFDGKESD
ncbi:MAG: hypothetical protein JNJ92_07165 [Altererythrobacter sp.]|nr:hypothetical protein [Altererythrobacter sp.]